jgi:cytochrome c oxidase cbb3-type subunit 2
MNRISIIMVGVLATVIASLFGLVLIPNLQFEKMQPKEVMAADGSISVYPAALDDYSEAPGKEVYRSMGCVYCHSQQIRPEGFGADIDRGWGQRRSVPRDYILQDPPFLGTMRTGPDLANIGTRQPSEEWQYLHLYDPQITSPGSVMPPFKFMFVTAFDARPEPPLGSPVFRLPDAYSRRPTWIVPNKRAINLVSYLKSLQQSHDLEEVQ